MALFKPEVGTVGGTNLTAYSPPAIDYSGVISNISSVFSQAMKPEKPEKLSETELKNQFITPFLQKQKEIMESSEIPDIKKSVLVKQLEMQLVTSGGASYYDAYKAASAPIQNYYDPAGDQVAKFWEGANKWADSSEEGQSARVSALVSATDKDGNVDDALFMDSLSAAYTESLARQKRLLAARRANETNKESALAYFTTTFAPDATKRVAEDIKTFTSQPVVTGILKQMETGTAFGPSESGTAERIASLLDEKVNSWKAQLQKEMIQAGVNPNEGQYSVDPLISELTALRDSLRNASTSTKKALDTANETEKAIILQSFPAMAKQAIAMGASPQAVFDQYVSNSKLLGENVAALEKMGKSLTVHPYVPVLDIGGGEPTIATGIPNQRENGTSQTLRDLPEWNPDTITKIAGYDSQTQIAAIDVANDYFKFYTAGKIESAEEADKVFTPRLLDAYGVLATRQYTTEVEINTPLSQTKVLFGPNAFNMAQEINSKSPKSGEELYKVLNKTIQTEAIRHTTYIAAILNSNFPNNPFSLTVDEKGNVKIKVDPVARREDPVLKAAVVPTISGGRGGAQQLLVIPDSVSDEQIFELAMGQLNKLPTEMEGKRLVSKTQKVKEAVESLNYLLKATDRLPDNLKNSPAFAGIGLRETVLTNDIRKYRGMNPFDQE